MDYSLQISRQASVFNRLGIKALRYKFSYPVDDYPGDILVWRVEFVGKHGHFMFQVVTQVTFGAFINWRIVYCKLLGTLEKHQSYLMNHF